MLENKYIIVTWESAANEVWVEWSRHFVHTLKTGEWKKNPNLGQANVVIAGHSVASYLQKYVFY